MKDNAMVAMLSQHAPPVCMCGERGCTSPCLDKLLGAASDVTSRSAGRPTSKRTRSTLWA
eukprot:185252-Heterocapsa_arctica.AAC.1